MANYLVKFCPLARKPKFEQGVTFPHDPPFIDSSCRREPDLQSPYPSITNLCRPGQFAVNLNAGDIITYITVKALYHGFQKLHWRLVAKLQVLCRFNTHCEAATWYRNNGYSLPSNCMVRGNSPIPLERTYSMCFRCANNHEDVITLQSWERKYEGRKDDNGVFLICKTIWKNLNSPAIVTEEHNEAFKEKYKINLNPISYIQLTTSN